MNLQKRQKKNSKIFNSDNHENAFCHLSQLLQASLSFEYNVILTATTYSYQKFRTENTFHVRTKITRPIAATVGDCPVKNNNAQLNAHQLTLGYS